MPCVTPWGAPPAGVLFTPEAFARYSVSSRTVSDVFHRSSLCIGRHARQHDISICLHLSIRCGLLRRRLRSMQMLSFLRRLRLRPRQVRSTKICDACRADRIRILEGRASICFVQLLQRHQMATPTVWRRSRATLRQTCPCQIRMERRSRSQVKAMRQSLMQSQQRISSPQLRLPASGSRRRRQALGSSEVLRRRGTAMRQDREAQWQKRAQLQPRLQVVAPGLRQPSGRPRRRQQSRSSGDSLRHRSSRSHASGRRPAR